MGFQKDLKAAGNQGGKVVKQGSRFFGTGWVQSMASGGDWESFSAGDF